MKQIKSFFAEFIRLDWQDYAAHIWTSVLSFLAFAPFHFSILTWLAPLGIFYIAKKYHGQYKKLIVQGIVLAVIFNGISFYWEIHMMTVFGEFPLFIAIPLFLLSGPIFNTKFPLFLVLYSFLSAKTKINKALLAGTIMTFAELITWQIFPWYWGNLVAGHLYLSQLIEYIGVYGLTFVAFALSQILFHIIQLVRADHKLSKSHPALLPSIAGLALILSLNAGGYFLYEKWLHTSPVSEKNVLVIQPDSPLEFRDGRSFRETMIDLMLRIEKLTDEGAKVAKPDLIVLPESGVPYFSAHNSIATTMLRPSYWPKFENMIALFALKYKASVFFNEIDADFKDDIPSQENHIFFNNAALYDPNGQRRDSYRKSYLLMFGEYMPFEFMYLLSPQTARFMPGKEQNLIPWYSSTTTPGQVAKDLSWDETENLTPKDVYSHYKIKKTELKEEGKFLPLICYEVIIPEFVRKFRKNGNPDFIVNITNDKWYGKSVETFQHLDLARIRSIEHRRWMIRSTSSGTSALIDHLGRIVNDKFTGQETAEFYAGKIQIMNSEETFYVKYGNLIPWLLIGLTSILIALQYKK